MIYVITYDQYPEEELMDAFKTLERVKSFAIEMLDGKYTMKMSQKKLTEELLKNGYFLEERKNAFIHDDDEGGE